MSTPLLDPWTDAAAIATRLNAPSARLTLIIGATGWCETCRTLKPVFESLAAEHGGKNDTWLWLDLEDHAEFLDDFIPDSLPLLVSYRGAQLTHALVPSRLTAAALADLLGESPRIEQAALPDIRARLMAVDWAT
ncbi:thioredoxin [Massilia sp. CCM 8733]|uniref:Thioredoxin n=1 Tax=Massilia mucilaginosa TaxID=2609282 RepID=A0ABX0P3U6_9BURK|nr:thioredoxin family protein [Massilia mucilaginosa]NHZ93420.1 thioredoxin [Massilia mucilaginosa]